MTLTLPGLGRFNSHQDNSSFFRIDALMVLQNPLEKTVHQKANLVFMC